MRGDAHPRRTHARAGWRGWRGAGDPDADAIEAKEEERENIDLRQEKQKDRHSGPLLLSTSRDLETYSDHPEPRAAGPISLSPLHLRRSRGGAGEEAEERRRCCDRVGERERGGREGCYWRHGCFARNASFLSNVPIMRLSDERFGLRSGGDIMGGEE